ncbi:hypothetical protein [Actinomadura bangladeshensis]|uniref:DUF11 domain-containing protein n=1 Tax=Actinomadura bangladeshensis TaxID=453573 RepID=A0A4R4P6V0_9ACTN|nr:hypothetical protein [Actinomadura bangladeshensis]TDC16550.1 hypothetical protein E1284_12275 [Actinomadura bangladeshensis]
MICRSAVKPVFIGLGTAAILATGGASALADATPSPSGSTSTSPAPADSASPSPPETPELVVGVKAKKAGAKADEKVGFTITAATTTGRATNVHVTEVVVSAKPTVKLDVTGACPPPAEADGCDFGSVDTEAKPIETFVSVPAKIEKLVSVTFSVTVEGTVVEATDETKEVKDSDTNKATVTFTPLPKETKSPTASPSRTPTKPSPSPSATKSSSGTSGGGSSGGSGSGGGSTSGGTSGYVPPSPNSSFDPRNPQVALPSIQAPSPSVAPSPAPGSATPQSRLQGNKAPVAQDITFERMASTQIAWLAALLVAFSLLLTQLRLGRRRVPAGAAAKRPKGSHRRPRRGMFGK